MNKSTLVKSIVIIATVVLLLIFSVFYILYLNWGDTKAVQNSLSATGSIFGAIATLGASIIAVYLFNDWRDEHNHNLKSSILLEYLNRLDILEEVSTRYLRSLKHHSKNYSSNNNLFFSSGTEVEVFIELVQYYHEQYYGGGFASWTNANKFSLLDNLDFKEVYLSINRSLNKSFEVQYKLKTLLTSKAFESISEEDIQKEINLAIEEAIKALEQIKKIRSKAISEIKAKN